MVSSPPGHRSQASPTESQSLSACAGFSAAGQLSISSGTPSPSPSSSSQLNPSSTIPSQSSSMPLQISAPGWIFSLASSQSSLFETYPSGWKHATTMISGSPYPSASASAYQVT